MYRNNVYMILTSGITHTGMPKCDNISCNPQPLVKQQQQKIEKERKRESKWYHTHTPTMDKEMQ